MESTNETGNMVLSSTLSDIHAFWVGAGALYNHCLPALRSLYEQGARITICDTRPREELRYEIPQGERYEFFCVGKHEGRSAFRNFARDNPFSHIYIGNWPDGHLPTAIRYADFCTDGGIIIMAKPLDTNHQLIRSIAGGLFTDFPQKLFVHDHYRNKGGVQPLFNMLPSLIANYAGRVNKFRAFLVEPQLIEDEGRLDALECGIIYDLHSHLFSHVQLFFLPETAPGLTDVTITGMSREVTNVRMEIVQVVRARYHRCELVNPDVETFAAIHIILHVSFRDRYGRDRTREIHGLLVAGKGITAERGAASDVQIKAIEIFFEDKPVSLSLKRNTLTPNVPEFVPKHPQENGYFVPIVEALSSTRADLNGREKRIPPLMTFEEAAKNADYLNETLAIGRKNPMLYYHAGATLAEVLNICCSNDGLHEMWRPSTTFVNLL